MMNLVFFFRGAVGAFMGSGTTAKMAHLQKRRWIGSEMSKEYVDLANKRIKPYLDQISLF